MRTTAPAWHEILNAGKESITCDLKAEPERARALCADADVVIEGFRPGVANRLGIGPPTSPRPSSTARSPASGSAAGTAPRGPRSQLPGLGGTARRHGAGALPPAQLADLAAGSLAAVTQILAALLAREKTGRGGHLVVSMTHGSHRFAAHRLGGEPIPSC